MEKKNETNFLENEILHIDLRPNSKGKYVHTLELPFGILIDVPVDLTKEEANIFTNILNKRLETELDMSPAWKQLIINRILEYTNTNKQ